MLRILDKVQSKAPIEDNRVELKATWPDPEAAARRLAAHANAAGTERILWLIGVDERQAMVVGANYEELSKWLPAVNSYFDQLSLPLLLHINVPYNGPTVVALLFDSERAPFVVKNPSFGKSNGGPVQLEVPWREGTSARSAHRSDLLRILQAPKISNDDPLVLVLGGSGNEEQVAMRLQNTGSGTALNVVVSLNDFDLLNIMSIAGKAELQRGTQIKGAPKLQESFYRVTYSDTEASRYEIVFRCGEANNWWVVGSVFSIMKNGFRRELT